MQYINKLSDYENRKESAVTFGKFDGLHTGHQKLVDQVQRLGKEEGLDSIVCAFEMQPLWERMGRIPQILMTGEERQRRLKNRVDILIECPFTAQFSRIQAKDFIRDIISGLLHAKYVVVGTDFQFGYGKQGDIHLLGQYEKEYGYRLIVIEKERYGERIISSTYIKELLTQGEFSLANQLLGYSYGVTGMVEHGKKLGRTLGFPTLNVAWPERKIVPPRGVYLSKIRVDGEWFHGISNVGVKPTVSREERVLIESFLFGYDGDAYGKEVTIDLLAFRRPERSFESVAELKSCIDRDIEYGKHFFANVE